MPGWCWLIRAGCTSSTTRKCEESGGFYWYHLVSSPWQMIAGCTRRTDLLRDEYSAVPCWQAAQRVLDIWPGNGEQDIVEACGRLDGACGRALPEPGNLAGKRLRTSSATQHHFMAGRQCFPCERKRDCAGADRSELHHTRSCSVEKSRRTRQAVVNG